MCPAQASASCPHVHRGGRAAQLTWKHDALQETRAPTSHAQVQRDIVSCGAAKQVPAASMCGRGAPESVHACFRRVGAVQRQLRERMEDQACIMMYFTTHTHLRVSATRAASSSEGLNRALKAQERMKPSLGPRGCPAESTLHGQSTCQGSGGAESFFLHALHGCGLPGQLRAFKLRCCRAATI